MKNRKAIPAKTRKLIFQEANSACPFCSEKNVETLEIHHIYERAIEGGNEPENLILVCANCHSLITNETITKSEVIRKKYSLMQSNLENESSHKKSAKIFNINSKNNYGIIGDTINYNTTSKSSPKISPPENSIASDLNKRNYIKRLIDRYNDFKKADKNIGDYKYSIIYKAIQREFKCKWDMVPIHKFDDLVQYLQYRIDKTILGRTNKSRGIKNYSSFMEFLEKMK